MSELFREHYLALVRLACLLLDERGAGEEVVQDAFVRLHGTAHRVRDPDAAPAYLRSIVLNLARSRMRRRLVALRRHPRPSPDAAPVEEIAILREDQREVLAALRTLPTRQRECLALRYFGELSEAEIAATLGISPGSVKTHTSRGIAALTSKLEKLA
ncbi:MAG: SigE family RNA polymerase sigma factor [Acidimicrobiia bacterium]